jgi:protein arginine kinase
MTEKINVPPFLVEKKPWGKKINTIWPSSTLTLRRNLNQYDFPSKLSNLESEQLLSHLKNSLLKIKEIDIPFYLKAPDLNALDKEFLFEQFLLLQGFPETLDGEAFIIDSTTDLLLMLNIEDHLQIHLLDTSCDLEKSYRRLSQLETSMANSLNFAFNPQFGYLTSDPDLCGTALTVNTFLHIPALIHSGELVDALETELESGVFPCGLEGTPDNLTGDILILSNLYTLGNSEGSILRSVESSTLKVIALENALRTQLKNKPSHTMKDLVGRAFGLLIHSHQLETHETLNALSLIKLGIELNWISGIEESALCDLFFKCRKAHLAFQNPTESLPQFRATFLHQHLNSLKLNI